MAGSLVGGALGKAVQAAREAGVESMQHLMTEAMLNPELFKVLMTKVSRQNQDTLLNQLTTHLRRVSLVGAVQNSDDRREGRQWAAGPAAATPPMNRLMQQPGFLEQSTLSSQVGVGSPTAQLTAGRDQTLLSRLGHELAGARRDPIEPVDLLARQNLAQRRRRVLQKGLESIRLNVRFFAFTPGPAHLDLTRPNPLMQPQSTVPTSAAAARPDLTRPNALYQPSQGGVILPTPPTVGMPRPPAQAVIRQPPTYAMPKLPAHVAMR